MAIRALGELNDKSAAAVLTPLLQSKKMFEADYAAAALAALEGKPYVRPQSDAKTRAADLNMLPDKLGLVGQAMPPQRTGQSTSLVELVKAIEPRGWRSRSSDGQDGGGNHHGCRNGRQRPD